MICPACREEMIVVEYQKIELDICASCGGVWFDKEELGLLLGTLQLEADELGRALTKKTEEKTRKCPYCRGRMAKVLVGPGEGVMIDRCKKGHGLWFDGGEVDAVITGLRKAREAERPDAAREDKVGSFLNDVLWGGKNHE